MSRPGLLRSLGLGDATMLIVGCIVGVGIFRTASSIAGHLQSPLAILIVWIVGALLSTCGALCYAELAAMFPSSGGDYVYLTKTYGRCCGFLFGWTKLFIERTGTIAILGFVFAEYCGRVVPYGEAAIRWVAAGAIVALTIVNIVGVRSGTFVQNIFTMLKIVALVFLIAAGVFAVTSHQTIAPNWAFPPLEGSLISSMGLALVFVIWTYGGWTEASYVAEEITDPTRNIPRAIFRGLALVTILYLLVNWTYLLFVPVEQLSHTPFVASTVMERLLGQPGSVCISVMVACSAFGALNGYILTGARILFAIGKDHPMFAKLGVVHSRFRTPARALWVNALLACVLVFTKTFDQIVTYSTVAISVFFIMSVFAVCLLRRTQPQMPRPYRAWGYPVTPLLFCIMMLGVIFIVCVREPQEAVLGFGLLALGLPLYWISNRASQTRPGLT